MDTSLDLSPSRPAVDDAATTDAFYQKIGPSHYRSTVHAQGAWDDAHQHMAPVSGLLTHAIEECDPRPDLLVSRIAFDILGVIPAGEIQITAQVLRPGRTIELVQAELSAGGRVVVRATAWRLAIGNTAPIAGSPTAPLPGPDEGVRWQGSSVWDGGFIRSLEFRVLPDWQPGHGRVWLRTDKALVADTVSSPLARFVGLIDTANGIAVRADPTTLLFPNTDLTIHLTRTPEGPWVGLDTEVTFGADGVGLTSSTLFDTSGLVGRAAQTLTLRPIGDIDNVRQLRVSPFRT